MYSRDVPTEVLNAVAVRDVAALSLATHVAFAYSYKWAHVNNLAVPVLSSDLSLNEQPTRELMLLRNLTESLEHVKDGLQNLDVTARFKVRLLLQPAPDGVYSALYAFIGSKEGSEDGVYDSALEVIAGCASFNVPYWLRLSEENSTFARKVEALRNR